VQNRDEADRLQQNGLYQYSVICSTGNFYKFLPIYTWLIAWRGNLFSLNFPLHPDTTARNHPAS